MAWFKLCISAAVLALASCGGDSEPPEDDSRGDIISGGSPVSYSEVLCLSDTGDTYINEPGVEVIRDNQRFVERYLASNPLSQDPVPDIDFNDQMVISINQGLQPSLGYGVEVTRIEERNSQLVVNYDLISPTEQCLVEDAASSPFCFVALDRTDAEVVFERNDINRCATVAAGGAAIR